MTELLSATGANYACVVDPDTATVLAEAGDTAAPERLDASAVSGLGAQAALLAAGDGPSEDVLEDLMVGYRRSVHVVRPVAAGPGTVLLYAQLPAGRGNPAAVRREMASALLRDRLRAALLPGAGPQPAAEGAPHRPARPVLPPHPPATGPGRPAGSAGREAKATGDDIDDSNDRGGTSGPAAGPEGSAGPADAVTDRQPALTFLATPRADADVMSAAIAALAPVAPLPPEAVPGPPRPDTEGGVLLHLPRRVPGVGGAPPDAPAPGADGTARVDVPPVLSQRWSGDLSTMERLLAGLRRLP